MGCNMAIDFASDLLGSTKQVTPPAAPSSPAAPAPAPATPSAPAATPAAAPATAAPDFATELLSGAPTAAPDANPSAPAAPGATAPKRETGILATLKGFGQGVMLGGEERLLGMGQATGLDWVTYKGLMMSGALPKDLTFEEAQNLLKDAVTDTRKDITKAKSERPGVGAGALTADIGLTAAAAAPAALVPGGPLLTAAVTGGASGAVEGATRSEGQGETKNRLTDATIGAGLGAGMGMGMYGTGQLYSKFISPKVAPYIEAATGKIKDAAGLAKMGAERFTDYGRQVLKDAGYNAAKVSDDVAEQVLRREAENISNRATVVALVRKAGKVDPAQVTENLRVFRNIGVKPTLGQVTDNMALQTREEALALSPVGEIAKPLIDRSNAQFKEELPAATQVLIDKLNPNSLEDIGSKVADTAQKVIDKAVSARSKAAGPLYGQATAPNRLVGEAPVSLADDTVVVAGKKLKKEQVASVVSGASKNFVQKVVGVESSGNPTAKAATSSATGLGQFIDSTWLRMMKKYKPDLVAGKSAEQILAMRTNPALSREMVGNLATENGSALLRAGVPVNDSTLYLSHFLGPTDAIKVLKADAGQAVQGLVKQASVDANQSVLSGKTAGQVIAWAQRKMGGAKAATAVERADLMQGAAKQAALEDAGSMVQAVDDPMGSLMDFLSSKRMATALSAIRKNPAFADDLQGLPDNSMKVLHYAKQWIDDTMGEAKRAGRGREAGLWGDAQHQLLGYMDDATRAATDMPDLGVKAGESLYGKARGIFSSESKMVDDLAKGPAGAIADLAEGKMDKAADRIFQMRVQDFRTIRDQIRGESPEVWDALVADHVQRTFMKGLREGGTEKLYQKLYQTKAQAELMDAALEHSPEKHQLFKDLMRGLEIIRKTNLGGSQTAKRLFASQAMDEEATPVAARAIKAVDPSIVSKLGEGVARVFRDATKAQYANAMSSQKSVDMAVEEILTGKITQFLMSEEGSKVARAIKGTVLNREDQALLMLRALGPVEKGLIYTKNVGSKAFRKALEQAPGRVLNAPIRIQLGPPAGEMSQQEFEQMKREMQSMQAPVQQPAVGP